MRKRRERPPPFLTFFDGRDLSEMPGLLEHAGDFLKGRLAI
jgi:hypothetical protein